MDEGMFLKRPKPEDTEDDLLAMQESWQAQNNKATVQIHKMKSKTDNLTEEPPTKRLFEVKEKGFVKGGRFEISLEDDCPAQVIYSVEEKNVDWLAEDRLTELAAYGFDKIDYSKESGFPLALDLSSYYTSDENGHVRNVPASKSFFAAEFDRLHGKIDEATCSYNDVSIEPVKATDFSAENDRYISKLAEEKITEMQNEIQSRLDAKTIQFIKNRHKEKGDKPDVVPTRMSKFKKDKLVAAQTVSKTTIETKRKQEEVTADYIKELEVLGIYEDEAMGDDYERLAADAIQMDITAKCMKSMLPRQERNALRLFDNLKAFTKNINNDPLVEHALACIEDIKLIYLEEIEKEGRRFYQFAAGLNPVLNTCSSLRPIRSVVDAVAQRENHDVTADDVEIVRLSLLWTVLLLTERASMFYAYAEPKEFYARLTEVFLLGSEITGDDISMRCVDNLMDSYVLKSAIGGRLHIRLEEKIAGLDAFAPYFDDLLNNYESYSLGNISFARAILIGAYLNSSLADGLMCQFSIFSPKKNIARQIVANNIEMADILAEIRRSSQENALKFEDQYYQQYVEILGAYAAAIRDDKITRERNQLMFTIASEELGRFVNRHAAAPPEEKDFDIIIELVRSTVKGKLDL